jgi:hypothetical protein
VELLDSESAVLRTWADGQSDYLNLNQDRCIPLLWTVQNVQVVLEPPNPYKDFVVLPLGISRHPSRTSSRLSIVSNDSASQNFTNADSSRNAATQPSGAKQ